MQKFISSWTIATNIEIEGFLSVYSSGLIFQFPIFSVIKFLIALTTVSKSGFSNLCISQIPQNSKKCKNNPNTIYVAFKNGCVPYPPLRVEETNEGDGTSNYYCVATLKGLGIKAGNC